MLRLLILLLLLPAVALAQIQRLPHIGAPDDGFGGAVALDAPRALVGAANEEACGPGSGAVYVFEADTSEVWHKAARLAAPDCAAGMFFGRAVALSGSRALVAASGEFFASRGRNSVYVFEQDSSGVWANVARLAAPAGHDEGPFGASIALDGDRAVVTAGGDAGRHPVAGAAYVYERDEAGAWSLVTRLEAPGGTRDGIFGARAVLDGDRLLVTAPGHTRGRPGSLWIFDRLPDGVWGFSGHLGGFRSGPLDADLSGDRLVAGEPLGSRDQAGQVVVLERQATGLWTQTAAVRAPSPDPEGRFGSRVALDGDRFLAVAYDEQIGLDFNVDRIVHVFAPETTGWAATQVVDVGDAYFASDLDVQGRMALVGHARSGAPGAAYLVMLR